MRNPPISMPGSRFIKKKLMDDVWSMPSAIGVSHWCLSAPCPSAVTAVVLVQEKR
jgi:hypothetical protein